MMGREAIRRFVELAIPNHTICKPERSKGEDVGMGEFFLFGLFVIIVVVIVCVTVIIISVIDIVL